MKKTIAVLTSSRADYGIYRPLLRKLQADDDVDLRLIVFGTHTCKKYGYTVSEILEDNYKIDYQMAHDFNSDDAESVSKRMAQTIQVFSAVWNQKQTVYDAVFCLGDRYEIFAAAAAAVPFNIKLVHLHGGETSLGAIDNTFRHCLSLFSSLHFTATQAYVERVAQIMGTDKAVFNVGALSLDNLKDISFLSKEEFRQKFGIDLNKESILVTFHPETVCPEKNEFYVKELLFVLARLREQIIITMPNADTTGLMMRKQYESFAKGKENVVLVEHFGTQGYFTCMKYAKYLLGNTSSGIIEAASFHKYVLNVGNRQLGRHTSANVLHVPAERNALLTACKQAEKLGVYEGQNDYYQPNVAHRIIKILKEYLSSDR